MIDIEVLKKRIIEELEGYSVYFSPDTVPANVDLPNEWKNFGFVDGNVSRIPEAWGLFINRLPWVASWLESCVLGTFLVVSDKSYLLYVYSEENELSFYIGGVPIKESEDWSEKLSHLKDDLRKFYSTVHNGFGFYIGCTMGPSRAEDFVLVEDLCDEFIPSLSGLVTFFSSGAGDYLALDPSAPAGNAYIWWHEKPESPDRNIDLWAVMDAWMSIFLENSDSNEGLYV